MQLSLQRLSEQLPQELRSLYILHGDEALLLQEAADAIRATARQQGFLERHVFIVAGAHFDWGEVESATSAMSLFADKQLIDIRIPSGKPGKDGSVALQQIAERAQGDDATLTLVLLPKLDSLSTKSAWFGALESFGVTIRLDPVDRRNLPAWIAQRLQQHSLQVAPGEEGQRTLHFFAERVEGNLLAAHQEIQKLALLYPTLNPRQPTVLSFDQVENAVLNVARYDVFKLSEAVLAGQGLRVARMLDGLQAEGESEVLVHWALAEDIRSLKRVKDAMAAGRPLPMALRENRVWGAKEKLFERVLPQIDEPTLAKLLQSAHKVDGIVKGLKQPDWPSDGWQSLHRLAGMLCTSCAAPQAGRSARPLQR